MPATLASTGPVLFYVHLGTTVVRGDAPPDFLPPENKQAFARADGALVAGARVGPAAGNRPLPIVPVPGQPVFLGTCERSPRVVMESHFHELPRDDLGSREPWDLLYESEGAWVFAELNRFNEYVLSAVQDRLYQSGLPLAFRGMTDRDAVGTLLRKEGKAYALTLNFPYARKLIYALNGMPATFTFPHAVCWGPDEWETGSQPRKVRLAWRCLRFIDERFEGDEGTGTSLLYYHDPFVTLPPAI